MFVVVHSHHWLRYRTVVQPTTMQHKSNSNHSNSNSNNPSTKNALPNVNNSKHPTIVSRKVALLGYRAVGKSCVTNSFLSGAFSPVYDPTIESTYHKTIRFRKVHFTTDIVDTAGMVCPEKACRSFVHVMKYFNIAHHSTCRKNVWYRTSIPDCLVTHRWVYMDTFWYLVSCRDNPLK